MADDFNEEPEMYINLVALGHDIAATITATPLEGLSGSALYIAQEARRWKALPPPVTKDKLVGPAADILELLRRNWLDLCAGKTDGEKLMGENFGTWAKLMRGWPMQQYASQVAEFLRTHELLNGLIVELGAGVGSASALVAEHVKGRFICSDAVPFLMRRRPSGVEVERYDFDESGKWAEVDTFFAVNALHCARDKRATLAELYRMLKTGGTVVLAESVPTTDAMGTPWPLNMCFGLFKGWWDRGGLIERERWFELFRKVGFRKHGHQRRMAGNYDLGGLIWAEK
jgi:SAM-dependent methyltransferase